MAIVLVLVLLVAVGGGVAFAMSNKNKKAAPPSSAVSPTRPAFTQPTPAAAPAPKGAPRTPVAREPEPRSGISPSSGLPKLGYEAARSASVADKIEADKADARKADAAKADAAKVLAKPAQPRGAIAAAPAPVAPAAPTPAAAAPTAARDGGDVDDADEVEDLAGRFNRPGERTTGKVTYEPTVPRKPVILSVLPVDDVPVTADASAVTPDVVAEAAVVEPEVQAEIGEVEIQVEADLEVIEAEVEVVEVEATIEPAAEPEPALEALVAAESELVIDLDEPAEPILVLDDSPQPLAEPEVHEVDHVLKALIGRVRITHEDVDAVASELVDRADLDADGVAEVLADLAEIAEATAEAERLEELTLFSEEVPSRPGQLTRFAELDDVERRRVIIRVLCLLVARADDGLDPDDGATSEARVRAAWPVDPSDADDPDLPNRVGLVKS